MVSRIYTIGVYGFEEESFFRRLGDAHIDCFCDIRFRRGMRGKKYAFVNAKKLQDRLQELGIKYIHCKELAPTTDIRDLQKEADQQSGVSKRERLFMANVFVQAYQEIILSSFSFPEFMAQFIHSERLVLFCVEKEYRACHRSLVAERLRLEYNVPVEHLGP